MNITDTAAREYCIGCGVCVACCPKQHLLLQDDRQNIVQVAEHDNACLEKCSICLQVCPFSNSAPDEDAHGMELFSSQEGVLHHPAIGWYTNCYVGYAPSEKLRREGASGGMATYLLTRLMKEGGVDAVLLARRRDAEPYFEYALCRDEASILANSRSSYYPVSVDKLLRQIMLDKTVTSVAVTALPCTAKAIRDACLKYPLLKKKIKCVIGLVCGQLKTKNFADYLAAKEKMSPLQGIDFRTKAPERPNGNYGVRLFSNGKTKEITFSSYAKEWSFSLFTPHACNFCDDVFAECADVVFMDAWLPEYKESVWGENLIVSRSNYLDGIFNSVPTLNKVGVNQVLESQRYVLEKKRQNISYHLTLAAKRSAYVPKKRGHLHSPVPFLVRPLVWIKYRLSTISDSIWYQTEADYGQFRKRLRKYMAFLYISRLFNKLYYFLKK